MKPEIRIGLIGCGRAAELIYLPAFGKFPAIHITAVVDPLKERREIISGKLKNCSEYISVEPDFLNQIDAAVICTPPDTHISLAADLLRSDKFVLVEKPLAPSMERIGELIKVEENSKASLMMGFNHRYWLPAVQLKKKLSENTEIFSAGIVFTGDYSKWNPVSFYSDPLNDLGPHVFDLIRFIFQKEIISVAAEAKNSSGLNVKIRIEDDLVVTAYIAHSDSTEKSIKIYTGEGDYFLTRISERIAPEMNTVRKFLDLKDKIRRKILRQSSPIKKSFELQMENFFRLIESKENGQAGLNDGIAAIIAVNAVSRSIKNNGKEICLK